MSKQLVYIQNKVNNAAIRRIRNGRGDVVYVVPSYTLPDNVVMNGGLYSAEEIEKSYKTLEDAPAPIGHPYDENGNYISASSPDGTIYFQCGAFNKNVQRVSCPKFGNRVYAEKHIHVETAMKYERGKRLIEAIDRGEAIHTSTGVLLEAVERVGNNERGEEYTWVATNMHFDHDAILFDEEGAATPSDGVGMMVNHNLFKTVRKSGELMHVNTVQINQSMRDQESLIADMIRTTYGDDDDRAWLMDWGEDYAVFESMESGTKRVPIRITGDKIEILGEPQKVKRVTAWEPTASEPQQQLPTTNQEGKDMAYKERIESALKKAEINIDDMSDDEKMNAYDKLMKGNAAEPTEKPQGEQSKPEGETVVNADVAKLIQEQVEKALQANQANAEKADRDALADKLKANEVDIERAEQDKMSVNSLRNLVDKTTPKPASYGLNGGTPTVNQSQEADVSDLPE